MVYDRNPETSLVLDINLEKQIGFGQQFRFHTEIQQSNWFQTEICKNDRFQIETQKIILFVTFRVFPRVIYICFITVSYFVFKTSDF